MSRPSLSPGNVPVALQVAFDYFGQNHPNRFSAAVEHAREADALVQGHRVATGIAPELAAPLFGAALVLAGKARTVTLPRAFVETPLGRYVVEKLKGFGRAMIQDRRGNIIAGDLEAMAEAISRERDEKNRGTAPRACFRGQ